MNDIDATGADVRVASCASQRFRRRQASKKNKKDKKKARKAAKKAKKATEVQQAVSQTYTPGQAYADSTPLDRVTYLEAKLILKPDRFTSVQAFRDFGKIVQKTAKATGVGFVADAEAGLKSTPQSPGLGPRSPTMAV